MIKLIKIFAMLLYNSAVKYDSLRNKMIKYLLKYYIISLIYNYFLKYISLIGNTMIYKILYKVYKVILFILIGVIGLDFSYLYFDFKIEYLINIIKDLPDIAKDFIDKIHNFIRKIINRIRGKNDDENYCEINFTDYIYSPNEEAENNYINENQDNHINDSLNPYYIFILSIILKLTGYYYGTNSDFQSIVDDLFKDYVSSYITPEFTYKVIYAILFGAAMKYCNEITISLNQEEDSNINDNQKETSNINNSIKEDSNSTNDNNINNLDDNSNKTMEDRIKEIKDSRLNNISDNSSINSPTDERLKTLTIEDRFYYNSVFQKEKDLEDKGKIKSDSINTTDFKEGIIDNEETPKSSPNRFFSFFNIENKWSSNKDSKFIAGKDINEMQANLNKEIEDLDQP